MLPALVLSAIWLVQAGAPTGAIRGVVVDARTAAPVVDARVTVVELGTDVVTQADGRFAFTAVPPATYTLTVSRIDYAFVRRRITVASETIDLTIPLAEGTGTYQERITVTPTQTDEAATGTATRALGSAALQELRGLVADDPMRAVQALPGVATGDDFQAQFSGRGSAFRHVGLVIDGTPAPVLLHAVRGAEDTGTIAMINTDVLSRAAIQAGPHLQRHGDWIGATLEFDVREGARDRVVSRAAVSGTNASFVLEGPLATPRGSFLVSVRKSYLDWLIRKVAPDVDGAIGFYDAQLKLAYDLTPRQQLQLLVIGGDATYQEENAGSANGLLKARSGSLLASAVWRFAAPRVVLSQRVSHVGSDFQNTGLSGQGLARGYTQGTTWRGDVLAPLGSRWSIEGGGRVEDQRMNELLQEYMNRSGVLVVRHERDVSASYTNSSAWVHLVRHSETSSIGAGLRATSRTGAASSGILPSISAERRAGAFTLRLTAGQSLQFADPALVDREPGPLEPERATSVDLGVEHRVTGTMRWSAIVFYRDERHGRRRIGEPRLDDAGRPMAVEPFPTYATTLDGRTHGIDLAFSRSAPSGLRGWIGYTYSNTRYVDTESLERFDGDFDQRHTLNVFAEHRLSYRAAVSAKLRVGSNVPVVGYYEQTGPETLRLSNLRNRVRLPLYARLDLRATRTFTSGRRRITLSVEVMNVLDRTNVRQTEATVRPNLDVVGLAERLIPFVPSAGILIEF
jgi:hypothetical protein